MKKRLKKLISSMKKRGPDIFATVMSVLLLGVLSALADSLLSGVGIPLAVILGKRFGVRLEKEIKTKIK